MKIDEGVILHHILFILIKPHPCKQIIRKLQKYECNRLLRLDTNVLNHCDIGYFGISTIRSIQLCIKRFNIWNKNERIQGSSAGFGSSWKICTYSPVRIRTFYGKKVIWTLKNQFEVNFLFIRNDTLAYPIIFPHCFRKNMTQLLKTFIGKKLRWIILPAF